MIGVLVTGANGQLGQSIHKVASEYSEIELMFKSANDLDISDDLKVAQVFNNGRYRFCINCAAYTNVEKAENEREKAYSVNAESVRNLAKACLVNDVTLIHISTDYVFDGQKEEPYTIDDTPNPINVYGASKLRGEKNIIKLLQNYFIIRTSWLYSEFGKNFYKTILKKAQTENKIYVTDRQRGRPTHAENLARFILDIVVGKEKTPYGIYHFTDGKTMTWYDFAKSIIDRNDLSGTTEVVRDKNYRSFVKRPDNSILQ